MEITLNDERLKLLRDKIRRFFEKELDEPVGDLKADLILEFFVRELGPQIYNQAVEDAHAFIQDKLIDLESTLYAPE